MEARGRLKRLVIASVAIATVMFLGLASFTAREVGRRDVAIAWVEHTHAALDELQGASLQVKDAEIARQTFRLDGSPAAQDAARRAAESLRASAEALQNLTEDNPPQAARAVNLAAAAADIRASVEARFHRGSPVEGDAADARAERTVQDMEDAERSLLASRVLSEKGSAARVLIGLASVALLAAASACLALYLILNGLEERERAFATIQTHEKALLAANAELEAFNYSVSHDLRAPLRAIDGFARILEKDYSAALGDEPRRLLGRVRVNSERMGRLIDALLSFSRLGRQSLKREEVDMGALARRAADDAALAEPGRAVKVTIGALPPCVGDHAMLSVVWDNLLSNAFKYTRPRAEAHIEIGGAPEGEGARYWVKDDGVGFDPRYMDKLFGVFSRLHDAMEFEGTGIGLALVRRVLARHGGEISAESALDKGTTFRFTMPRRVE